MGYHSFSDAENFIIMMMSSLSFFSFVVCAFGVVAKKPLLNLCHKGLLPFFLRVYSFSSNI